MQNFGLCTAGQVNNQMKVVGIRTRNKVHCSLLIKLNGIGGLGKENWKEEEKWEGEARLWTENGGEQEEVARNLEKIIGTEFHQQDENWSLIFWSLVKNW